MHEFHPARRLGQRTGDHPVHGAVVEHTGDAADVVEVVVTEDQQRDAGDAQAAQAAINGDRIRAGVDLDRRVRSGRKYERVTLTDVARDQHPVRRRPARREAADRDLQKGRH